jgi:YVTN family beta-propeller protein
MRFPSFPTFPFPLAFSAAVLFAVGARADFVNFETPQTHPVALSPDGKTLAACNTADNRVEFFDLTGATPAGSGAVVVGMDPTSVRWRSATELWVVNQISDSVSIIDVAAGRVTRTVTTQDEPADVVFAGSPLRAFVSCSQARTLLVFDPANLDAAPLSVELEGEDPRALAVSPDGTRVYAAIFESGNGSTILGGGGTAGIGYPPNAASDARGPYSGTNPPPNNGAVFNPPKNPANGTPPKVGLIVRQDTAGAWRDDNGADWTPLVSGNLAAASGRPVGWKLLDNDVAIINAATLSVTYAERMMNLCMALGVNPVDGSVCVVGTDATNERRFEPVVNGTFVRVKSARFAAGNPGVVSVADLNPHLTYTTHTLPQAQRDRAVGDPRAIEWAGDGTRGFVAGMGSNNVIVLDATGQRLAGQAPVEVGEGPTGLAIDDARGRAYVLNRFEATVSVIDLNSLSETARVAFFDPTPAVIRNGRPHLYDTHATSGLGQASCASCHIDSRMDRLAWDLGDPAGTVKVLDGNGRHNLGAGLPGMTTNFTDFHPMKGPMTTQTLQDIIGKEPHHWRGDRDGLEEFNGAFQSLLGDDTGLTPMEMQAFEDYLATIHFPPNPYRNADNSLPTDLPLPDHYRTPRFGPAGAAMPSGNAKRALDTLYRPLGRAIDQGAFACVTCHTLPTGMGTDSRFTGGGFVPILPGPKGERHHALVSIDQSTQRAFKTPQTRNVYDKVGFETTRPTSRAGFGFFHDGSVDSITRFVSEDVFTPNNVQEVADLVALLLCFSGSDYGNPVEAFEPPGTASKDAHASVGKQVTLSSNAPGPGRSLLDSLVVLANGNRIDLVAHAAGRGWKHASGSNFDRDQAGQSETLTTLLARGEAVTFTAVPKGSGRRVGIDRDRDTLLDYDEVRDFAPGITGIQNPFAGNNMDSTGNNGSLIPDGVPDGQNDFDNDGISNAAEIAAGTNPVDNLSVEVPMAPLADWDSGATALTVTWQAAPLGEFAVRVSDDLETWEIVPASRQTAGVNGGTMTWTDTTAGTEARRFYSIARFR